MLSFSLLVLRVWELGVSKLAGHPIQNRHQDVHTLPTLRHSTRTGQPSCERQIAGSKPCHLRTQVEHKRTLQHLKDAMSGIEIAGLVLGALPLVVSALDKYKTAGNAFKRFAWKWRYEIGCLSRCVKTQHVLYRNSLRILLAAAGEDLLAGSDPADLLAQPAVQARLAKYLEEADTIEVFVDVVERYKSSLDVLIQRLGHVKKGSQVREKRCEQALPSDTLTTYKSQRTTWQLFWLPI